MHPFSCASILFAAILLGCPLGFGAETMPSWKKDIVPILQANCYRCHGAKTRKAELDLRSAVGLRKGGEAGSLLERGQPDETLLFEMVDNGLMPPKEGEQLTAADIEVIRRWIAGGADGLPQVDETMATDGGTSPITQHDVLPLLFRRCTVCHGAPYLEGDLDFRTRSSILASGAVALGKPDQSAMVQRVRDEQCPPSEDIGEAGIEPMTADELKVVEKWILLGAPESSSDQAVAVTAENDPLITEEERQFWAFRTPKKRSPPTVEKSHRARNPIDSFLLARLEERGLEFSPKLTSSLCSAVHLSI